MFVPYADQFRFPPLLSRGQKLETPVVETASHAESHAAVIESTSSPKPIFAGRVAEISVIVDLLIVGCFLVNSAWPLKTVSR